MEMFFSTSTAWMPMEWWTIEVGILVSQLNDRMWSLPLLSRSFFEGMFSGCSWRSEALSNPSYHKEYE